VSDLSHQKQTIFGNGKGNCFAACIASLIGTPLAEVPNFCLSESWLGDSIDWLRERGWGATFIYHQKPDHNAPVDCLLWSSLPLIATGRSPRGEWNHCVVVDSAGKLVHDPHPDNTGILTAPRDYLILFPLPTEEPRP
jgi:hypothetical protein